MGHAVIFIDEGHCDYYEGDYGFSHLPVHELPTLPDVYDEEEIEEYSENRDNYPIIGKALVKFDQDGIDDPEIVEKDVEQNVECIRTPL